MQFNLNLVAIASLVSLAVAKPLPSTSTAAAGVPAVGIIATTWGLNNPSGTNETISCPLNSLCDSELTISALQVAAGSGQAGIDASKVECRMYRDAAGTLPGSLPFTVATKANVATNTVTIGSILCYVFNDFE